MKLVFLGALLFLTPAYSYKFLCNGITAEGVTESDQCTESCISASSHWPVNAPVLYNVDISVLPTGISASDWLKVVDSSFSNWANTPGAKLTISNGGYGVRSFGDTPNSHDIFWVTSEDEWMTKVGAAPNGILGVTLPPYACPTSTVNYRQIDDADMILNAVPSAGFIWEAGCPQLSDSCQSAKGTVAHESGHFLGLGHPCAACQELMSAQAEFLIEYPLFDDQQGLAALYPDSSAAGSFGTVCSSAQPCLSNLTCHSQAEAQYCSKACAIPSDCGNNMVCNSGFCEFPAGVALGAAGLGAPCTQNCDKGFICVAVDNSSSYCFAECTISQTCQTSETCHQLKNSKNVLISSYACMVMAAEGEACGGTTVCQTGLTCISSVCKTVSGGTGSGSSSSHCSSAKAPSELWLLLLLMGILVHRPKKKC
ncbi:MAG: hypothetical protein WCK49_05735 [Myxococcaceae bacterium]